MDDMQDFHVMPPTHLVYAITWSVGRSDPQPVCDSALTVVGSHPLGVCA